MAIPKRLIGVKNDEVMARGRPIKTMAGLAVGFLFIAGVAFWAVLLPEIQGGADEDGATETADEAPAAPEEAAPSP